MTARILTSLVLLLIATQFVTDARAEQLDLQRFQELHQQLRPDPDAKWRTIPWKLSLLDAQAAASESGKPIFIWAMDGHPLGCT